VYAGTRNGVITANANVLKGAIAHVLACVMAPSRTLPYANRAEVTVDPAGA